MAEPPLVTISDPNRPGAPVDVVGSGSERDPWRPGRRTWVAVAVLVALAAVAVPVQAVRQQAADDRALDKAALADVRLAVTVSELLGDVTAPEGTVLLGLRNDGTLTVTAESYQVLSPGYRVVALHQRLRSSEIGRVLVPDTATCAATLLTHEPQTMRVMLRTSRGQRVSRDVALGSEGSDALGLAARSRCRYLGTDQAVQVTPMDLRFHGRDITAVYSIANTGRLPLRVISVVAPYGFSMSATPRGGFAVPSDLGPRSSAGVTLTVRLHVEVCDVFRGIAPPGDFAFGDFASLDLTAQGGTGPADVRLNVIPDEQMLAFVHQACPHTDITDTSS